VGIPKDLDELDVASALERVGGDEDLLKDIAGIFLEECPSQLADVRDAVRAKDAEAIQSAAHSLKGSVGNFGANRAHEAALRLEMMGRNNDISASEQALTELEHAIEAVRPQLEKLASS